jgi:methylenetetrahydrofolate dehydrogenase (NADP+)/methenyltetrahydrofolate cyclohydrolase
MIIFRGNEFAQDRLARLAEKVRMLKEQGKQLQIAAILFSEDKGSQLYTELKRQAAQQVGIAYQVYPFSMNDPVEQIATQLATLNAEESVTGIIIQKPWRARWQEVTGKTKEEFQAWWSTVVTQIAQHKDVDGLHPDTLRAVEDSHWKEQHKVLPATAKAVLEIFHFAEEELKYQVESFKQEKILIIGKSDLLGKPLYFELRNQGYNVQLLGTKELAERKTSGQLLLDAHTVISSTGQAGLVTGEMVQENVILIDVGEPKPDIHAESVSAKAAFLTPVPGGVGPVTVVSLLENCVALVDIA